MPHDQIDDRAAQRSAALPAHGLPSLVVAITELRDRLDQPKLRDSGSGDEQE
jgi:hypothetical protein